jgi:hypothetical protein
MTRAFYIAAKPSDSVKQTIFSDTLHHEYGDTLSWVPKAKLNFPIRYFGPEFHDLEKAKKFLHSLRTIAPVKVEIGNHAHILDDKLMFVAVYGLHSLAESIWKKSLDIQSNQTHEFVDRITIANSNSNSRHPLRHPTGSFNGSFEIKKLFLMQSDSFHHRDVKYEQIDEVELGHFCKKCHGECKCY